MGDVKSLRDKLRAKTVGAKKDFKGETVTFEGEKFEVREPTERQRAMIFECARTEQEGSGTQVKAGVRIDTAAYNAWGLICCVFVPGTNEHVFEETDYDTLVEMPASQLDGLKRVVGKYINADREALAKNSAKTTDATSSSN